MKKKSNFKRFLLLWTGELVSGIGGGLTSFGLGVYVFGQTGSAADMALVTLLAFLPTLLLSVPAGVLADRYDRRMLMMLGDGCSAVGILFILVCMLSGGASLTEICIGVTISSIFFSLLEPSYRATVTDLLDTEEYSRASGMVSLAGSARYLISPILAGVLLTVSDIRLLLILDIGTFFLTVLCTRSGQKRSGSKNSRRKGTVFCSLANRMAGCYGKKRGFPFDFAFLCYDLLYGSFSDFGRADDSGFCRQRYIRNWRDGLRQWNARFWFVFGSQRD